MLEHLSASNVGVGRVIVVQVVHGLVVELSCSDLLVLRLSVGVQAVGNIGTVINVRAVRVRGVIGVIAAGVQAI
jgi:hypothetical protein